jgi:hypothetical protein
VRGSVATCRAGPGPHSAALAPEQDRTRPQDRHFPKNPAPLYPRPPRHPTRPPVPHPHPQLPTAPTQTPRGTRHSHRPSTPHTPPGDPGGPDPEAEKPRRGGQENRRWEGRPTTPAPPEDRDRSGSPPGRTRAECQKERETTGSQRRHTRHTSHPTPHPETEGRGGGLLRKPTLGEEGVAD